MAAYDVLVLGLGGMGSAAAYHLAKRGARVLGVEQFGAAHAQGSSHGRTRVIRQVYAEAPDYVPLLLRAYDLWYELEREAETQLVTIVGGLYLGPADAPRVAGAVLSATAYGIAHEMLTAADIQRRFPLLRPQAGHVGLLEYKAGILVPEQCVATHIDLASRHGAELRLHEAVESWDAGPNHVTARTSRGTYEAGALVITAGPWAGRVLHDLDLPLRVERVVQYWFEPRDRVEEFARLPIYGWDDGGVYAYGFPHLQGQGLKCAFHQAFQEVTTPQAIRREVGEEETARMRAHLARFMPDAAGTLLATATCMYTNTPDHHFIIDRHPAYRNVALACGFSGHGFKFCGVVGEVLADLALAGETQQPIDFFALRRFKSTVR